MLAKKKTTRSTVAQINFMIEFMKAHPNFAKGKYTSPVGYRAMIETWEHLKELLKAYGPDKSIKQWRLTWRDIKKRARVKNTRLRQAWAENSPLPDISAQSIEVVSIIGTGSTVASTSSKVTGIKKSIMTKSKKISSTNDLCEGKVLNFDHIVFWVGNAKTAASYFVTRLGFKPLAIRIPTKGRPVLSHAVQLNKITIIFKSPTSANGAIPKDLTAHGDFVKDIAFKVQDLDSLVQRAKEWGTHIVKDITEEQDVNGVIRYAVLKTYGDNTHTLIDRSKYEGILLPGYQPVEDDPLNTVLPDTGFKFIDHVESNMAEGTLDESVLWYEKILNMRRFWCVDYVHDLVPYSCMNSVSVVNQNETVLLSMNEPAKGLLPISKVTEFVNAHGTSGVEHIALHTDDIVSTMRSLKARGVDVLTWPPTYYELIKEKLEDSPVKVAESIDALQEQNILIDFDERGYMLQAFTKHVQARPTLFIEILQRRNHRGFGAMNYKWVYEARQLLETSTHTETQEIKGELLDDS